MDKLSLQKQITTHEGLRLHPYKDTVGKLTIGVGRNLDDVGISQDEALYMLVNDLNRAESSLRQHLPWFETLDDMRQRVLIDMTFNLGIRGMLSFTRMLQALRCAQFNDAAQEMLASKWAQQVGERATTLAHMMMTGNEP